MGADGGPVLPAGAHPRVRDLVLLAVTALGGHPVFAREPRGESAWSRAIAPGVAAMLLRRSWCWLFLHYGTLPGAEAGSVAARALPDGYAVAAAVGVGCGLILQVRRDLAGQGQRRGTTRNAGGQPEHCRRSARQRGSRRKGIPGRLTIRSQSGIQTRTWRRSAPGSSHAPRLHYRGAWLLPHTYRNMAQGGCPGQRSRTNLLSRIPAAFLILRHQVLMISCLAMPSVT